MHYSAATCVFCKSFEAVGNLHPRGRPRPISGACYARAERERSTDEQLDKWLACEHTEQFSQASVQQSQYAQLAQLQATAAQQFASQCPQALPSEHERAASHFQAEAEKWKQEAEKWKAETLSANAGWMRAADKWGEQDARNAARLDELSSALADARLELRKARRK